MTIRVEFPESQTKQAPKLPSYPRRRTMLVVSDDDECISSNLLHAIDREFPWLQVVFRASLTEACERFEPPVVLILIDVALLGTMRERMPGILRQHPNSLFSFLQLGDHVPVELRDLTAYPAIRSVLPMNLKLDVWLAAIRLILLGGDYFPYTLLRSAKGERSEADASNDPTKRKGGAPRDPSIQQSFQSLTVREFEILELVAQGRQNKLIASALRLSEHTVKIHLHNIIRKLSVHNRTEAARLYFDRHSEATAAQRKVEAASEASLT